jgi:hypothetical protein
MKQRLKKPAPDWSENNFETGCWHCQWPVLLLRHVVCTAKRGYDSYCAHFTHSRYRCRYFSHRFFGGSFVGRWLSCLKFGHVNETSSGPHRPARPERRRHLCLFVGSNCRSDDFGRGGGPSESGAVRCSRTRSSRRKRTQGQLRAPDCRRSLEAATSARSC